MNTSARWLRTPWRLRNWPCASSSNNCTRSSGGGATILARDVGPACTSLSAAPTSQGIGRQRANISGSFSISPRATALNGKIGWSTAKASVTSTVRSIYWRDTSLISGPRISSLAIGDDFRRIFWPMPPIQKCGNFSRRCAAVQVALIGGAYDETLSASPRELRKVRDGGDAETRSPRQPLLRFEFGSIRGDSWLRWHSICNHI